MPMQTLFQETQLLIMKNQEIYTISNIKKVTSKRHYFNSIFTQDDTNDFSESSQDTILNINPKFSETFNVSPNEELFNNIRNNFLKYIHYRREL